MFAEDILEFESLRALVGRYVRSPLGRAELERLAPFSDRAAVENALSESAEGLEYLRAASQPQTAGRGAAIRLRFEGLADPAACVARLRIEGATLEAQEILELARLLDLASEARSILVAAGPRFPRLAAHAARIADLRDLARELSGKILTTPVSRWPGCAAKSSASARPSSTRLSASCAPIMKTARCRKISSPSATIGLSFP
jgi:DNA mismatch repair protein MutS2